MRQPETVESYPVSGRGVHTGTELKLAVMVVSSGCGAHLRTLSGIRLLSFGQIQPCHLGPLARETS